MGVIVTNRPLGQASDVIIHDGAVEGDSKFRSGTENECLLTKCLLKLQYAAVE